MNEFLVSSEEVVKAYGGAKCGKCEYLFAFSMSRTQHAANKQRTKYEARDREGDKKWFLIILSTKLCGHIDSTLRDIGKNILSIHANINNEGKLKMSTVGKMTNLITFVSISLNWTKVPIFVVFAAKQKKN